MSNAGCGLVLWSCDRITIIALTAQHTSAFGWFSRSTGQLPSPLVSPCPFLPCSAAACATLSGGLPPYTILSDKCYLTARKFPHRTADVVQQLFMSQCGEGLQLLTEGACSEGDGQPEAEAMAMGNGVAASAGGDALGMDEA